MTRMLRRPGAGGGNVYWSVVLLLVTTGVLGIMSQFGALLLAVAAVMMLLAPLRRTERLFRPILGFVVGGLITFYLLAPLSCTGSVDYGVSSARRAHTDYECVSLVGVRYRGWTFGRPFLAAIVAGTALGSLAWASNRDSETLRGQGDTPV